MLVGSGLLAAVACQSQFVLPAYYKGQEGPKYVVARRIADNIELRRYEPCELLLLAKALDPMCGRR
jgi:hypothetical protein